jgi:two-component system nitrate/nitrite response regulator NarL
LSNPPTTSKYPRSGRVKIALAIEEADYRDEMLTLLSGLQGVDIAGAAKDADSALVLMAGSAPHILLLDYVLCCGLQAREARHQGVCPTPVRKIVVLPEPEKTRIVEAFRLGAHGIVLKGSGRRILRRSIAAVAAGHFWLGNESLAALVQVIRESSFHDGGGPPVGQFGLTPREIEIVQKIAEGRSNKEVGQDFSIRERTVKHHLTNIFGKIGVSSRLELALFARGQRVATTPRPSHTDTATHAGDPWPGAKNETGIQAGASGDALPSEARREMKDRGTGLD